MTPGADVTVWVEAVVQRVYRRIATSQTIHLAADLREWLLAGTAAVTAAARQTYSDTPNTGVARVCPFCSTMPKEFGDHGTVWCENVDCGIYHISLTVGEWNHAASASLVSQMLRERVKRTDRCGCRVIDTGHGTWATLHLPDTHLVEATRRKLPRPVLPCGCPMHHLASGDWRTSHSQSCMESRR